MKVSVLQENLAKGLNITARAVSTRATNPVLLNVLLNAEDGRLHVSGNNLELGITARVGAKVDQEGAITVPSKLISEFINQLPPERVDMEVDTATNTLKIICGTWTTEINGISADEFPAVPATDTENGIEIAAPLFQSMIDQVVFAAAKDDNRPVLMGVLVRFEGNRCVMTSADGYRMAMRTTQLEQSVSSPISVIVPARTLAELSRIIGGATGSMYISVAGSRNQVMFYVDNTDVVSQLVDGKFPDVEALIPKSSATKTTMQTSDFLRICRFTEIFARETNNTSRLRVETGGSGAGQVFMRSEAQEQGSSEGQIEALVSGGGVEIAFNVRYLIDVLAVMDNDQLVLETNTAANPGVIKPEGRSDFVYVVMPMSVR